MSNISNNKMNNLMQSIEAIRNILRIEGITGMESINHCVLFIITRSLTELKCNEYNIPIHYAFERFKFDELTNKDLLTNDQKLFDKFFLKDKECLIKQIKQKLGFSQINFKIKSLQYFEKIYKILESLNINNLKENFDIIGIIYELHLRSGSSGSGMRDLGQYFTNRDVIKYMIKLCDPKLKSNGEIDKILDPSMGTGGFLTMSIKYLNDNNTDINWDANKNNIYGFDIDDNLKNLALLNVLLETGKDFKNTIVQCDSLKNDYLVDKHNNIIIDKVDIILANEPFGLKNIIHADCCNRIKDLKIRGTKGEPLFLQLMMQSLNEGGRCAVIVPDGVLFNNAKLHKDTRKYLCDKLNLKKVISLEDGLFLNTGVKSSILFFLNEGKTTEIEFCKIQMLNDEISEELIINVNIEKIKQNDYSLFVNKYNIVYEENINGIEYKRLGDICDFLQKSKKQASYGKELGKYKFFTSSSIIKYCDEADYNETCLIIGTGGNANIKISNNFSCSADNFIIKIKNDDILNYYLYYWFVNNMIKLEDCFHGSTIKHLSKEDLENIQIPIPHLHIQEQIISSLDIIYDTIENNSKQIFNYEKIKKNIIYSNTINVDKKNLEDIIIFEQKIKKLKASDSLDNGKYKFYTSSNKIGYRDDYEFNDYKIIIGRGGNSCVFYDKEFGISHDDIFVIGYKNNNLKYIYNYIYSNFNILQNILTGSTIKHINKENLSLLEIPIPSIEIQEYIVSECDYYDNLIKTLQIENNRLLNNKIIEIMLRSISIEKSSDVQIVEEPLKIIKDDKIKEIDTTVKKKKSTVK